MSLSGVGGIDGRMESSVNREEGIIDKANEKQRRKLFLEPCLLLFPVRLVCVADPGIGGFLKEFRCGRVIKSAHSKRVHDPKFM